MKKQVLIMTLVTSLAGIPCSAMQTESYTTETGIIHDVPCSTNLCEQPTLLDEVFSQEVNKYDLFTFPLHYHTSNGDLAMVISFLDCITKAYLHEKYNINAQDEQGNTALHIAALEGHEHIFHYLLQHGANPKLVNSERRTPFELLLTNNG